MKNTTIKFSLAGLALTAMLVGAAPAFALNASSTASGANAAERLAAIISRANSDIAARITSLGNLNTRVQAMKNESATEKSDILTQVQTNTAGLQALQTKIDADTDVTTVRADAGTIFTSFRIYALVIPRGYILAASDRVTVITGLMNTLGTKMQARITADQSAGKDVSALTAALTDMNAKTADANSQASTAKSGVTGLMPDLGNTTTAASNKAALVAARGNIKTASGDLQSARADIKTILQGLKALGK
jgi:hypothetical protein